MVTLDRLARTVREQVALGRLLPLGGPADAVWIAERAAVRVLRRTADAVPGVRLGPVSLGLAADPAGELPEAAPVGALPHGAVRVDAGFEAAVDGPLPLTADRLRDVLWAAAEDRLGLTVAAVDLRVTGLLDPGAVPPAALDPAEPGALLEPVPDDGPTVLTSGLSDAVAAAALTVPGVVRLTRRLAGLGSGVRIQDGPSGRVVQIQLALSPTRPALPVARAVLTAVTAAAASSAPGPVTAAVIITDAD